MHLLNKRNQNGLIWFEITCVQVKMCFGQVHVCVRSGQLQRPLLWSVGGVGGGRPPPSTAGADELGQPCWRAI